MPPNCHIDPEARRLLRGVKIPTLPSQYLGQPLSESGIPEAVSNIVTWLSISISSLLGTLKTRFAVLGSSDGLVGLLTWLKPVRW
ncbi:MAG: hypothetical protein QXO15_05465 [Nitrososphaerota archaeon]